VRQVFLLQVAPDVADAVDADRERLLQWGKELGLAKSVRILETVGRSIREMKSAPEKIVMLEVAMVRLTKPELDNSFESLDVRLTRLERGAGRPPVAPPPAPALRPIGSSVTAVAPTPTVASSPPPIETTSPPSKSEVSDDVAEDAETLSLDDVRVRFVERVVPRTSRSAQLLLRAAKIESLEGLLLTIAVPSEEMRQNTELISQGLKGALEHEFKLPLTIFWSVDVTLTNVPASKPRVTPRSAPIEEEYDGGDETVLVVDSAAEHLITEMFPGSEEIS
jgi:hypothetical protein